MTERIIYRRLSVSDFARSAISALYATYFWWETAAFFHIYSHVCKSRYWYGEYMTPLPWWQVIANKCSTYPPHLLLSHARRWPYTWPTLSLSCMSGSWRSVKMAGFFELMSQQSKTSKIKCWIAWLEQESCCELEVFLNTFRQGHGCLNFGILSLDVL